MSPSTQETTYTAPATGRNRTRASARLPAERRTVVVRRDSVVMSLPSRTVPSGTPSRAGTVGAGPEGLVSRGVGPRDAGIRRAVLPQGTVRVHPTLVRRKEFRSGPGPLLTDLRRHPRGLPTPTHGAGATRGRCVPQPLPSPPSSRHHPDRGEWTAHSFADPVE